MKIEKKCDKCTYFKSPSLEEEVKVIECSKCKSKNNSSISNFYN